MNNELQSFRALWTVIGAFVKPSMVAILVGSPQIRGPESLDVQHLSVQSFLLLFYPPVSPACPSAQVTVG